MATNLSYKALRKGSNKIVDYENLIMKEDNFKEEDLLAKIQIQKALMKVPETQRIVIILKFYQGMKYKEISEVIDCPLGTVKTRIYEGLKKMQKLVKKDE